MTDSLTDELFLSDDFKNDTIVFPISRLIVDPERMMDDEKELMSKLGMGVIYLRSSKNKQLRKEVTQEERTNLLQKYYIPHHDRYPCESYEPGREIYQVRDQ